MRDQAVEVPNLTLVLGGARSGKSRWAEEQAQRWPAVTYLATAQAGDDEMACRIEAHRRRRPADWATIEEPWEVPAVVARHGEGGLLLDCLSLWLTNLLVGLPGRPELDDAGIRRQVADLVAALGQARGPVIVVSSEVGAGLVPPNPLARRFADLLGEANQQLAAAATEVYWCVAGIPVRLKGPSS